VLQVLQNVFQRRVLGQGQTSKGLLRDCCKVCSIFLLQLLQIYQIPHPVQPFGVSILGTSTRCSGTNYYKSTPLIIIEIDLIDQRHLRSWVHKHTSCSPSESF